MLSQKIIPANAKPLHLAISGALLMVSGATIFAITAFSYEPTSSPYYKPTLILASILGSAVNISGYGFVMLAHRRSHASTWRTLLESNSLACSMSGFSLRFLGEDGSGLRGFRWLACAMWGAIIATGVRIWLDEGLRVEKTGSRPDAEELPEYVDRQRSCRVL